MSRPRRKNPPKRRRGLTPPTRVLVDWVEYGVDELGIEAEPGAVLDWLLGEREFVAKAGKAFATQKRWLDEVRAALAILPCVRELGTGGGESPREALRQAIQYQKEDLEAVGELGDAELSIQKQALAHYAKRFQEWQKRDASRPAGATEDPSPGYLGDASPPPGETEAPVKQKTAADFDRSWEEHLEAVSAAAAKDTRRAPRPDTSDMELDARLPAGSFGTRNPRPVKEQKDAFPWLATGTKTWRGKISARRAAKRMRDEDHAGQVFGFASRPPANPKRKTRDWFVVVHAEKRVPLRIANPLPERGELVSYWLGESSGGVPTMGAGRWIGSVRRRNGEWALVNEKGGARVLPLSWVAWRENPGETGRVPTLEACLRCLKRVPRLRRANPPGVRRKAGSVIPSRELVEWASSKTPNLKALQANPDARGAFLTGDPAAELRAARRVAPLAGKLARTGLRHPRAANPEEIHRYNPSPRTPATRTREFFREFHGDRAEPRPVRVTVPKGLEKEELVALGTAVDVSYRPGAEWSEKGDGPAFLHKFGPGLILAATPDGRHLVFARTPRSRMRVEGRGIVD